MAGRPAKGRNVAYIKNTDPAFIKKFKQRIGYKEEPELDAKRQRLEEHVSSLDDDSSDDRAEREDEKPVVVQLKSGDLSAGEAEKQTKLRREEDEKEKWRQEEQKLRTERSALPANRNEDTEDRVLFRKPNKTFSSASAGSSVTHTSARNPIGSSAKHVTGSKQLERKRSKQKAVKDNRLLSFGLEDEDENG